MDANLQLGSFHRKYPDVPARPTIVQGEIQQLSSRISILTEQKHELEEREKREKVTDSYRHP